MRNENWAARSEVPIFDNSGNCFPEKVEVSVGTDLNPIQFLITVEHAEIKTHLKLAQF
jgi:hypothetical protein